MYESRIGIKFMVQQIASMKTESAASSLPLGRGAGSFKTQAATGQTFNSELLRQFKHIDVYQQPVQPKLPIVSKPQTQQPMTNNRSDSAHNLQRQQQRTEQSQRNQDREAQLLRHRETNEQRNLLKNANIEANKRNEDKVKLSSQAAEQSRLEQVNKQNSKNTSIDTVSASQQASNHINSQAKGVLESRDSEQITQLSDDEIANKDMQSLSISTTVNENTIDASSKDEFDYISYVTKLAEFNEPANNQAVDQQSNLSADELALNAASLFKQTLENEEENNLVENSQDHEFSTVDISKQDLQIIMDAQNAQTGADKPLSQTDIEKLEHVLSNLLTQIDGSTTTPDASKNNAVNEADKALLQSLLLSNGSPSNNASDQSLSAKQGAVTEDSFGTISTLAQAVKNQLDGSTLSQSDSKQSSTSGKAAPVSSNINSASEIDVLSQLNLLDATTAAKVPITDNENIILSNTDVSDKKIASSQSPVNKLADLNEEQSKAAIDNIAQRLQTVLPELTNESKNQTFIGALQSSIKEFNQQLTQGRESGTDLKAIIAEALAAANVEVSSTKQPKIDATLNQFNAVLNIANAVNHAASLQHTPAMGITDAQLVKEMNHQHIEGTKFANNLNNQLSAQAASDKAVNIFKQEGQQQLAEKVRWMVNARNPSAEIRLDPPDLGGINIKINLSGDTAQVNFNVQSMAAKEALDHAAPKLREMLQQHGIELGQSSVQQDSPGQRQGGDDPSFAQNNNGTGTHNAQNNGKNGAVNAEATPEQNSISTQVIEQRITGGTLGGIDYYA